MLEIDFHVRSQSFLKRIERQDFDYKYKDMGDEFWRAALFTDEPKFNLFGTDSRAKIWRKPGSAHQIKNLI